MFVRGLGAIAAGPADPAGGRVPRGGPAGLPDDEARALAVRFVNAYLARSPQRATIARFVADGAIDRTALVPSRGPGVVSATVARVADLGGSRALITVAAVTDAGDSRYVAVPVARDGQDGLAVEGLPAFVPPPARAGTRFDDDLSPLSGPDAEAIEALAGRFVRAYVGGADRTSLGYLLRPGVRIAPMTPGLRVTGVDTVAQSPGQAGRRRSVVVTVRVQDTTSRAMYVLAYRLEVERRDRWYVVAVAGGPSA